ncbi:MAG: TIGR03619 family F420-dependent LLM class oxidoreductase [Halieaceae bacterium]|jgi:probable F420-dependent oxidoreductase|nr:TIGR03619 family F420-dependent LLM class oxidoreductase [Halieaceae bacterium]
MKFWQSIFLCEGDQIVDTVKIVDNLGFEGAMISEHLLHIEDREPAYPYSEDGQPPQFTDKTVYPECWSLMAALAAVTDNLRFVTNVFILPLHHPIEVAKATGSVAYFSDNRIILGAGAGWMKEEFDILGVDFASRGKRYDECIEIIRLLQTGERVEYHGQHFEFSPVQMCPAPTQPVPIYIGGISGPALRRTARVGDGWLGPGQTLDDALATVKKIHALREEYGRSSEPFEMIVPIYGEMTIDDFKRMEDAGVDGTVSLPFAITMKPNTTLEQKRAYLENYAENIIAKVNR